MPFVVVCEEKIFVDKLISLLTNASDLLLSVCFLIFRLACCISRLPMFHFDTDVLGLVVLNSATFSSGLTSFMFSRMGYWLSSDLASAGIKLMEEILALMVSFSLLKYKLISLK